MITLSYLQIILICFGFTSIGFAIAVSIGSYFVYREKQRLNKIITGTDND